MTAVCRYFFAVNFNPPLSITKSLLLCYENYHYKMQNLERKKWEQKQYKWHNKGENHTRTIIFLSNSESFTSQHIVHITL